MEVYASCKALIIGVGRYADPQYDLSYARGDAEAVAHTLQEEFGFDPVWTLFDEDATKQNITRYLEQELQQTDEDDGVVIFFAGHGITVTSAIGDDRGFLLPHDGDPNRPYANLSLTTIRDDYLPMIPAKHVFLIVDACYGGLALRDPAVLESKELFDDAVLAELTRRDRKVRQVLAAGMKDQRVLDGGLFGHSIFTGRFLEALRNASPYTTADHLGVHVREHVVRDSLDRKHRQTPQFGHLYGEGGTYVFLRRNASAALHKQPERPRHVTPKRRPEPVEAPPRPLSTFASLAALERESMDQLRRRVTQYEELMQVQPSLKGVNLILGRCYYLLGEMDAAAKYLAQSLSSSMDEQTRRDVERLLHEARSYGSSGQEESE
ncbi:MAG: caspase family protein [Candidatus Hydrogenedentes bacterium]|nr:caspase family protein [Candidatus Hydrogenedentota bacterium]